MTRASSLLIARAKTGLDMAIADVELAQAQLAAADGLSALPRVADDMPAELALALQILTRNAAKLRELMAQECRPAVRIRGFPLPLPNGEFSGGLPR